jgi:hypothetical protein
MIYEYVCESCGGYHIDSWSVIKNILEDFKIEKGYPNLGVKIS